MGQIVTFYSYKGGTGRSMALANVAWALASNGQKVLVIDWDLEAPGMHRYFRAFLSDKELTDPESKGLIEFVRNFAVLAATPPAEGERAQKWYEPHAQIWKWAIPLRWPRGSILNFGGRGEIRFVPAGRQGPEYAERINTFDWSTLYQAHGGDKFFESVREQLKREFDYVLIDSRTGVSDTSGICTIQMPDILVVCYTYNVQSILGASDIARRVLIRRPGMTILPVAMRVEFTETQLLGPMRSLAREQFGEVVRTVNRSDYFDKAEVPYYPKYSFFERLAAFEEYPNAKGSINADVRHLASLISGSDLVQAHIEESQRRDVAQAFDPTMMNITPDVSPVPVVSGPKELKWAVLAWGLVCTFVLLLLVITWKRLPQRDSISVSVDPPTATLPAGDELQMVATVHGTSDNNVVWTAALGKINSSGLYVAPAISSATQLGREQAGAQKDASKWRAFATQRETITATSTADRSRSATAILTITEHSRLLVSPSSVTLKPGEQRSFRAEFGVKTEYRLNWQISPKVGDLVVHEPFGVSFTAPQSSIRQRITLTASSPDNDAFASAGIELAPETSGPDRWSLLLLVAAAGALGSCVVGTRALLDYVRTRVLIKGWWLRFITRPLLGAAVALFMYFAVSQFVGPNAVLMRSLMNLTTAAFVAGFFADSALSKLRQTFNTLFGRSLVQR